MTVIGCNRDFLFSVFLIFVN